jgi:hypothetical protein
VVKAERKGFPAVKRVWRRKKQAFRQKRILVFFQIKFDIPAENIDDFVFPMDVGTEIYAGTYIAFVIPDIKVIAMNNVVFIIHKASLYQGIVIFAMISMIPAMVFAISP